jgi:very-short-patch-repair endonuclease
MPQEPTPDARCAAVAREQEGLVTGAQCAQVGLSSRMLATRTSTRGWTKVLPGVYLTPGHVLDAHRSHLAALLWAGDKAVLRARSAAWVVGIMDEPPPRPQLYLTTGKKAAGLDLVRTRTIPASLRRVGLRCTRVERTLADLCGGPGPGAVGEAVDESLRRGLTTLDRLHAEGEVARKERRAGAKAFRDLLAERDPSDARFRSRFEKITARILKGLGLSFVPNHQVVVDGHRYLLDLAVPSLRLAIECHSVQWHLGQSAFTRDMERHRRLTAAGWIVLYVTWNDVMVNPEGLRSEVAAVATARRAEIAPKLLPG